MMQPPSHQDRLPRSFYDRSPATVARELLGKALLRKLDGQWLGGWIVETEAYLSKGDLASHSARGRTRGNTAMFGPPGTLYVYPIHAKYCMNAVTESDGTGSAVLIRALEPVWGIERMSQHRGTNQVQRLTRGPAMLCQALHVDRSLDGADLLSLDQIMISNSSVDISRITTTTRVGISKSSELELRFFVDGNRFVSGRVGDHQTPPGKSH
jgi:DNA-3-methyladenine glycosylase